MRTRDFYDEIINKQAQLVRDLQAQLETQSRARPETHVDKGSSRHGDQARQKALIVRRDEEFRTLVLLIASQEAAAKDIGTATEAGKQGKSLSRNQIERSWLHAQELANRHHDSETGKFTSPALESGPPAVNNTAVADPSLSVVAALALAIERLKNHAETIEQFKELTENSRSLGMHKGATHDRDR